MNARHTTWIGISTAFLIVAAYSVVRADSGPTYSDPPLLFSGTLSDGNGPLSGSHQITLGLWKSSDTATAANLVCSGTPTTVDVNAGNFQLALDETCAAAFAQYRQIFYQVTVDGTAFPVQQVGSVPFARHSASDPIEGSRLVPQRTFQYGDDGYRGPLSYSGFFDKGRNERCNPQVTYEAGVTATRCLPDAYINTDPVPVVGSNGLPTLFSDPTCATGFPPDNFRYYFNVSNAYYSDSYPNYPPGGIMAMHAMTMEGPFDVYYLTPPIGAPPTCLPRSEKLYRGTVTGDVPLTDFVRIQTAAQ